MTGADSLILINHYKNVLESAGFDPRSRSAPGIAGSAKCRLPRRWPELWVRNDMVHDRAKQLIDDSIADESPASGWKCEACGEYNERQFAVCWNCGAAAT